jgi:2-(1,2-epoxy-1,2-dihydrophenyl)acetyl-CoA isomerase
MHSFGLAKQLLTDSFTTPFEVQLERERMGMAACGHHPDGREGIRAFVEKRKPVFPGAV